MKILFSCFFFFIHKKINYADWKWKQKKNKIKELIFGFNFIGCDHWTRNDRLLRIVCNSYFVFFLSLSILFFCVHVTIVPFGLNRFDLFFFYSFLILFVLWKWFLCVSNGISVAWAQPNQPNAQKIKMLIEWNLLFYFSVSLYSFVNLLKSTD